MFLFPSVFEFPLVWVMILRVRVTDKFGFISACRFFKTMFDLPTAKIQTKTAKPKIC